MLVCICVQSILTQPGTSNRETAFTVWEAHLRLETVHPANGVCLPTWKYSFQVQSTISNCSHHQEQLEGSLKFRWGLECTSVVEYLLSICKALGLITNMIAKKVQMAGGYPWGEGKIYSSNHFPGDRPLVYTPSLECFWQGARITLEFSHIQEEGGGEI